MSQFASRTSISPEQSRNAIEKLLQRYKAQQFAYLWQGDCAAVCFRLNDLNIRMTLPLPTSTDQRYRTEIYRGKSIALPPEQAERKRQQEVRRRWRALLLVIKAKLEAVESGISTLEEEFLNWIQMPNGQTVGEQILSQVRLPNHQPLRLGHTGNEKEIHQ